MSGNPEQKKSQRPEPEALTKEAALKALQNSGYLLESRVEKILRERGYNVYSNFSVPDPHTGKGREGDLFAVKPKSITIPETGETIGGIATAILIECFNNTQPILFFSKEHQDKDDLYDLVKCFGIPVQVCTDREEEKFVYLPRFINVRDYHHYFDGKIATQWCSFVQKGGNGDWMASHSRPKDAPNQDGEFDSLMKLNIALEYAKKELHVVEELKRLGFPMCYFVNPVLILQGPLWETDPLEGTLKISESNSVKFVHGTFLNHKESDLLADIITESHLTKYLDTIESELDTHASRLARHREALQAATSLAISEEGLSERGKILIWSTEEEDD